MCNPTWLEAHPSVNVIKAMPWLQGLYEKAKEGDLSAEDQDYLAELAAWLAEHNNRPVDDMIGHPA